MDSVRFGRALGFGARSAVRALAGAAIAATDAAAAPNPGNSAKPSQPSPASPSASRPTASRPTASAAGSTVRATTQSRETRRGIAHGGRRFGEAIWAPLVKVSGVLWLEVTGSFFGIFAVFAGSAVWTHRADLHSTPTNHDARIHLLVFLVMALAFSYFCISSFVRAYRR